MKQKRSSEEASTSNYVATSHKYGVFLSFRGADTRNKFTSHLYERLTCVGISVFKDDVEMVKGERINEALKTAISESTICIPIFSKNYATSKACLQELCHMVLEGKSILPIFYDVGADDVKLKTDLYKKALEDHEREGRVGKEEIETWEKALLEVGKILGYSIVNKNEANEITEITREVFNQLMPKYQNVADPFVEIDDEVESVVKMLDLNSGGCGIIGLCGMGGIGKTTLAKVVFNRLSVNFQNHCTFISNVRESAGNNELPKLQQQLYKDLIDPSFASSIDNINTGINMIKKGLGNKRFLLVLDDMDDENLLANFVGDHTRLANGSRIIITTREKRVLDALEKDFAQKSDNDGSFVRVYQVQQLDNARALQLFSCSAFKRDSPPREFKSLSEKVVSSSSGLPLALKVIGSLLLGHSKEAWEEAIEKLKETPEEKIQSTLMISYHRLSEEEQKIFLDIACYPSHLPKIHAYYMWKACGWRPNLSIKNLIDKSLVKVEKYHDEEYLSMHDVLKDFGSDIIQKKHKRNGGKVKRFLRITDENFDKIPHEERRYVEMLQIEDCHWTITRKDLAGFKNARLLRLVSCQIEVDFGGLFPNLRWIETDGDELFTETNFDPQNLVVLQLRMGYARNINAWWNQRKVPQLKVLEISCRYSFKWINFKELLGLEVLILDGYCAFRYWDFGCWDFEMDSCIGDLKKLSRLIIRECSFLACLPQTIGNARALEEILFRGGSCSKRFELPCSVGNLQNLSRLHLTDMKMEVLPDSIGNLLSLRELDLSGTDINVLPEAVGQLKELRVLRINGCKIRKFPTTIGRLMKLEELEAKYCNDFEGDVSSEISKLSRLRILDFRGTPICIIPKLPTSLTHLLINSLTAEVEIRSQNLHELVNIVELELRCQCGDNPFNVFYDQVEPRRLDFSCIWRLSILEELRLSIPNVIIELEIVNGLSWLKKMDLSFTELRDDLLLLPMLSLLTLKHCMFSRGILDVSHLKKLKELNISKCDNLVSMVGLDELGSLKILHISELRSLPSLKLWNCKNLVEIRGFDGLESLTDLSIKGCPCLNKIPTFSNLGRLSSLELWNCENMIVKYDFCSLKSLTNLSIKNLGINSLNVIGCRQLVVVEVLDGLESLTNLLIRCCPSIEEFPCLSNLRNLSSLDLWDCKNLKGRLSFDGLESLTRLCIRKCPSIFALELHACGLLKSIEGLYGLESLTELYICNCPSLESLPYLPKLWNLKRLTLKQCKGLVRIKGLARLKSLEKVDITQCNSLEIDASDLSESMNNTRRVQMDIPTLGLTTT